MDTVFLNVSTSTVTGLWRYLYDETKFSLQSFIVCILSLGYIVLLTDAYVNTLPHVYYDTSSQKTFE